MQNRRHERGVSPWTHGDPLVGETFNGTGTPGIDDDYRDASASLLTYTAAQLAAKTGVQDVGTPEQNQSGVSQCGCINPGAAGVPRTKQIGSHKTLGAGAVASRDICIAAELGEESPRQESHVVQGTPARAGPSQTQDRFRPPC